MEDLDLRLREMDEQGIDYAVLSTNVPGVDWFPKSDAPAHRARRQRRAQRAGDAITPTASPCSPCCRMQAPEAAAAELERAVGGRRRRGDDLLQRGGHAAGRPGPDRRLRRRRGLDVPLYIHPTYPLVAKRLDAYALIPTLGFLVDTTTAVLRLVLGGLYERHPDFKLVLGHAAACSRNWSGGSTTRRRACPTAWAASAPARARR